MAFEYYLCLIYIMWLEAKYELRLTQKAQWRQRIFDPGIKGNFIHLVQFKVLRSIRPSSINDKLSSIIVCDIPTTTFSFCKYQGIAQLVT